MQRISTLLQKLTELSENKNLTAIDIDLMMDYTRVLYADLIDAKKTAAVSKPEMKPAPIVNTETQNTPEEQTTLETPPPTTQYSNVPAHDIRTLIGINDKYLFISELFNNDKSAYDAAIKHLNDFSNAGEALEWTENELATKYSWDNENETTQSFYSLLNRCFPSM